MYFELDDINRRHSLYWDTFNINGWVRAPDAGFGWNYERGAIVGVTAMLFNESLKTYAHTLQMLLTKYEPPKTLKQVSIFAKEAFKMDHFKSTLKNRAQFALCMGLTDVAARVSLYRWINSGWQRPDSGTENNFFRRIPGNLFISAITAPISVPFEFARIAYYADKTFPEELQKGYKSYFNALRRIPFEEGPYYLFKGSAPFIVRNFFQTYTLFFSYDYMKDKLSVFSRELDTPYFAIKMFCASTATFLACVVSSPFYVMARQMIELWPKQNGKCRFDQNYRKALVHIWYGEFASHWFNGFKPYFFYNAPWMFTTLMLADSLGIFTYWYTSTMTGAATNTYEDTFS